MANGVDYIIKQDDKRSKKKTVHRSKLRKCFSRLKPEDDLTKTVIKVEDAQSSHNISSKNLPVKKSTRKRGRPRKTL